MSRVSTFVESVRDDIDASLQRFLEEDTPEIRAIAHRLVEISAEVAVDRMTGIDTSVAERAIAATYLELASATSTETAAAVVGLATRILRGATGVALRVVAGL